MKKLILSTSLLFSIIFFSCKKDSGSNTPSYYIKANVGGSVKNCTANMVAAFSNPNALTLAASASSGEKLVLNISRDASPVTTGTYNQTTAGTENTILYYPTSDVSTEYTAVTKPSSAHPMQIIISQLDDKIIAGSFSGVVYSESGFGTDSLLISDGSFNLARQ